MLNLTFEQLNSVDFELYQGNPTIKKSCFSTLIADPSLLPPSKSPNKKWNMFCHTLFGVERYVSNDCIQWKRIGKVLNRAMRPNINYRDGKYYLYYERVQPLLKKAFTLLGGKWFSEIYMVESDDLVNWSKPVPIIKDTKEYMHDSLGTAISNPFLITIDGKNRLYFSAGQTFIKDCGFCEPTYISYAESNSYIKEFIPLDKPILSPDKNSKYLNLCCGCLKVYQLADSYIGLQNGIYLDDENRSHSAIMLLRSDNGKEFEFVKPLIEPQVCENGKDKDWMAQFVYACCLNYNEENKQLIIHFNARNTAGMLKGRENIGFTYGKLKDL